MNKRTKTRPRASRGRRGRALLASSAFGAPPRWSAKRCCFLFFRAPAGRAARAAAGSISACPPCSPAARCPSGYHDRSRGPPRAPRPACKNASTGGGQRGGRRYGPSPPALPPTAPWGPPAQAPAPGGPRRRVRGSWRYPKALCFRGGGPAPLARPAALCLQWHRFVEPPVSALGGECFLDASVLLIGTHDQPPAPAVAAASPASAVRRWTRARAGAPLSGPRPYGLLLRAPPAVWGAASGGLSVGGSASSLWPEEPQQARRCAHGAASKAFARRTLSLD